jgi:hypothetical protein
MSDLRVVGNDWIVPCGAWFADEDVARSHPARCGYCRLVLNVETPEPLDEPWPPAWLGWEN